MINPYAALALVLAWGASLAGAAHWAYGAGKDAELAAQAREERMAQVATEAAANASAQAIANMKVQHVTVRSALEREIQTREVYRVCRSGPVAVRLLNSAPGIAKAASAPPAGSSELPRAGPAD
jgi:hypothetical protein